MYKNYCVYYANLCCIISYGKIIQNNKSDYLNARRSFATKSRILSVRRHISEGSEMQSIGDIFNPLKNHITKVNFL